MELTPELIKWAIATLAQIAAVYGAIKARLNALDKRCDDIDSEATRANTRIDTLLMRKGD